MSKIFVALYSIFYSQALGRGGGGGGEEKKRMERLQRRLGLICKKFGELRMRRANPVPHGRDRVCDSIVLPLSEILN